jgi:hypothetical protein
MEDVVMAYRTIADVQLYDLAQHMGAGTATSVTFANHAISAHLQAILVAYVC